MMIMMVTTMMIVFLIKPALLNVTYIYLIKYIKYMYVYRNVYMAIVFLYLSSRCSYLHAIGHYSNIGILRTMQSV
jgi:hypothetical protein